MGIRVAHVLHHIRECGDLGIAAEHGLGAGAVVRHLRRRPIVRDVEDIEEDELPQVQEEEVVEPGYELLELNRYQCRYAITPHDRKTNHRFCGAAVVPGTWCCEEHHSLMYVPTRTKTARLAKRV